MTSDTPAAFNMLVEEATDRIVLVGYAVHNGKKVFSRMAERMAGEPDLDVIFSFDVPRHPPHFSTAIYTMSAA